MHRTMQPLEIRHRNAVPTYAEVDRDAIRIIRTAVISSYPSGASLGVERVLAIL